MMIWSRGPKCPHQLRSALKSSFPRSAFFHSCSALLLSKKRKHMEREDRKTTAMQHWRFKPDMQQRPSGRRDSGPQEEHMSHWKFSLSRKTVGAKRILDGEGKTDEAFADAAGALGRKRQSGIPIAQPAAETLYSLSAPVTSTMSRNETQFGSPRHRAESPHVSPARSFPQHSLLTPVTLVPAFVMPFPSGPSGPPTADSSAYSSSVTSGRQSLNGLPWGMLAFDAPMGAVPGPVGGEFVEEGEPHLTAYHMAASPPVAIDYARIAGVPPPPPGLMLLPQQFMPHQFGQQVVPRMPLSLQQQQQQPAQPAAVPAASATGALPAFSELMGPPPQRQPARRSSMNVSHIVE